ncbi:hypothetical protein FOPG_18909 [Fusarium oxysporum f. sp. conglutinans race 2 54008]|uniref:Uncharacterized protein n=1 Tax=Fusarium oxysporum f. sp. conglutinans race 2 54008 TaxID=1089457 RepID=X0GY84_FUSOX|nr:hypothetical protein FOPG_18909 [Fusarium oxysporum f. sp. conglutinans race 2 54008]
MKTALIPKYRLGQATRRSPPSSQRCSDILSLAG